MADTPSEPRTLSSQGESAGRDMSPTATPGPTRVPGSISRRVTIGVVGVALLTLLAVGVLFYGFLGRYVIETQKDEMLQQAEIVAEQVAAVNESFPAMRGPRGLAVILRGDLQGLPGGAGIVVFEGGMALAVAGPPWLQEASHARLYEEAVGLLGDGDSGVADLPARGEDQRLIMASARAGTGDSSGLVLIVLPASEAVSGRSGLLGVLFISALIGVGLAVAVGLGLGAWLSRPLRRLARSARDMAGGSYDEPVTGEFTGEVYDLASSMETMRREVNRSEQSLRAFVASAAHELRTPLTSIAGFSQALLDGTASEADAQERSAAAIYRESERLKRLVDALLTLSRYDSREFTPRVERVDVARLVREEISRLEEAGVMEAGRIEVVSEGEPRVTTDPDMVRQIAANLLKNATAYGGTDPVRVRLREEAGTLVLEVTNGGDVLTPEEAGRVFERFYRGCGARATEGFGLGLPLVREIAEVLGGKVDVHTNRTETTFRVTLPPRSGDGRLPSASTNS